MRRRDFIAGLGLATIPATVWAQKTAKPSTIGILGTASASAWGPWTTALTRRLHELGWIEGRNLAIEYRWAEGRSARFAEIAAEFVRLKVDVIVTSGGAVRAVKQETSTIPIVFAIATDPVESGLVASLARPGGNVTGLSTQTVDLSGKRIELLREVVPGVRRLGIIFNAGNPNLALETRELAAAAQTLGFAIATFEIRRPEDITPAIQAAKNGSDALYVQTDPLTINNRVRIVTLALSSRLPTMYSSREFAESGGLMSYGANYVDLFCRTANYIDKILRGAQPADLPVEQPTKFDFIINMTTARALDLAVAPALLARADEVID